MKIYTFILLFLFTNALYANDPIVIAKTLDWAEEAISHNPTGQQERQIWSFEGAFHNSKYPTLPVVMERFPVASEGELTIRVLNATFESLNKIAGKEDVILSEQLIFHSTIEQERSKYFGKVFFSPIIKKGNRFEKLVSYELQIEFNPKRTPQLTQRGPEYATSSVLKDGRTYKIAVSETGMHKIDYALLQELIGQEAAQIDPRSIRIYGNGGGMLPESIAATRLDDLQENAIYIEGEGDGSFDPADFILFYAEGPHEWKFDKATKIFHKVLNIYDDNNYYFLKITSGNGLRVREQASLPNTAYTSTAFDDFIRLEDENVNLLDNFASAQGTGKNWYGDLFETIRERTYQNFSFPDLITEEPVSIQSAFTARNSQTSTFEIKIANTTFSADIRRSNTGDIEDRYAHTGTITESFSATADNIAVQVIYPAAEGGTGWLDYIQLNARRALNFKGGQLAFRDKKTLDFPNSTFIVNNIENTTQIWDVTNPIVPAKQSHEVRSGQASFGTTTTDLKEFIAFNTNGNFFSPMPISEENSIENQNLHAINDADLVIIYPPVFEKAAEELALHRRSFNGYNVQLVPVGQIYNEFSSGRQDPTAIRDFAKMIYDRSPDFNYLLLFGDGSFDYKNIKKLENPSGFIPVYETEESLDPINGFPSDDYFALLSDQEGVNLKGALDIAVGRIPVKTTEEAQVVVKKLINYDTNPSTLGDWRVRQAFVADDEDGGLHQRQGNDIATKVDTTYDIFNVDKIFLDAYQQITTPGGQRYPAVKEAINNDIFKGLLVINYMGHGGSTGWTQERVLQNNDIISWTNFNKLPLFVTATCSFTGYDDPNFTTAGELVLLSPSGGGIGLFTTVRAVYSSSNERLTKAVFEQLFEKVDGEHPPIGELMRLGKNSNSQDTININARKFTLIGDPSMKLALPKYTVVTDKIDGVTIKTGQIDTIRAVQKVTIEGYIADGNGEVLSSFNGKIFPTIFDKKTRVENLNQDRTSRVIPFDIQKNVLFKGTASVRNGRFQFSFVVPKDINYEYGFGKVSYYAENGVVDAAGFYNNLIIGGTNPNAVADKEGPIIEVFMNDSTFMFGGTTDPNPTLLVQLSDENGINIAGTSIGHDLTGVLDNNTQNTLQLNEFYESKLDSYTEGTVRYPLKDLAVGTHQIKIKAWDVCNNSSEGFTEFIVSSSAEGALEQVLNYPNPFTTNTDFQFLHNLGTGQLLEVQIRIFTVSGRLIKTIDTQALSEGNRVSGINWDGRDDYGGNLARGVYLYKVSIRPTATTSTTTTDSDFQKLVLLK